jgi:DNA-binding GntR family transcriptional regulator
MTNAEHPTAAGDRSLRHLVEAHLLAEIRSGRLRPGDRLDERGIARTLGVSLSPVREAIFRLVDDGVVVHPPRRSFYVAELTHQDIAEIYRYRAMLEALAAGLAAERITADEIAELERVLQAGAKAGAAGDVLTNAECNAAFHATIIAAARNPLVTRSWRMLTPLEWLPRSVRLPPMTPAQVDDWLARHRHLLVAIRSGDAAEAEQVARSHVLAAGRVTVDRLAQLADAAGG